MLELGSTALRPARTEDLPLLAELRNDPELQALLLAVPRPNPTWRVEEWIRQRSSDPDGAFFVIADRESDRALGFVQITGAHPVHRRAELGICLHAQARGKGYAAEAMALAEQYGASTLGLHKLVLHVLATNERALALYARLGYRLVGTHRGHFYSGGAFHDVVVLEKELVAA